MKINLIKLRSIISNKNEALDNLSNEFLTNIHNYNNDINFVNKDGDFNLFLIETGGTEEIFIKIYKQYKPPYYLLTSGNSNSLAASIEILSYLRNNNIKGEIIHGDIDEVASKINNIARAYNALNKLKNQNLGVIGKPSDWLIASNVNYKLINEKLNVNMIDVSFDEFKKEIDKHKIEDNSLIDKYKNKAKDINVLKTSLEIYSALKRIINKYRLSALTIRCFDLLGIYKNTSCLALAILNSENITCSCEGDIPSLLTMHIINSLTGESSFQANPARINTKNNEIILAHCTVPFTLCRDYEFDTHFESQLGIGIKGYLKEENITLAKFNNSLDDLIISKGKIIKNLNETNLCRTQILVKTEMDLSRLLTNPLGNHHIIAYGDYCDLIQLFFELIK